MSRKYELCYVLKQDTSMDQAGAIQKKISSLVKEQGGTVNQVDEWPSRPLSYPIASEKKGKYIFAQISADHIDLKPLNTYLSHQETILRYDTYRMDDDYDYSEAKKNVAASEQQYSQHYSQQYSRPPRY